MADADLVIRNGTVVQPHELALSHDIAVTDGSIAAVGPNLPLTGVSEIDASGLHVFPGGVDPHVHFNEPRRAAAGRGRPGGAAGGAGGARRCRRGARWVVGPSPANQDPRKPPALAFLG